MTEVTVKQAPSGLWEIWEHSFGRSHLGNYDKKKDAVSVAREYVKEQTGTNQLIVERTDGSISEKSYYIDGVKQNV